ncbi:Cyclin-dependent kinase 1 [Psilocybe cubensis]|uniref:Cyclin-dependent kinase 1 n=2 Tax=Psilocybe cubensis TaxID=181762 RepID=A0ACB8GK88_PSICU|nr:Cyclin-dependent kinase 1 [Psilocybe cubensis]KAH9476048.1 Cyclin-dependent kinase 1 [Psilocybe cubensis]
MKKLASARIYFDPGDRKALNTIQLLAFWDSMRKWFAEKGYHLYEFDITDEPGYLPSERSTIPYNPHPKLNVQKRIFEAEDPFPYAYVGGDYRQLEDNLYEVHHISNGRVVFAQDAAGRHVVIKIVKGGSDEDKILHLLAKQPELMNRETFPSVIPVLDLLPCEDHWFTVMPRWDSNCFVPSFPTPEICVQQMVSLLKGLAFLHSHRIFHRDLCDRNLLINHFSNATVVNMTNNPFRRDLLRRGALTCVLSDFDHSILLDEETYGPNPRLGILEAHVTSDDPPYETLHGHVDYDPFKYDVALLGILFNDRFQNIIKYVPLLAPLIERMVTSKLDKRFTAKEALAFAEGILPTLTDLQAPPLPVRPQIFRAYYRADLWKDLSEEFVAKWADYREDRSTLSFRFLLWLNDRVPYGTFGLYLCRLGVRAVMFVPRLIFRPFVTFSRFLVHRFNRQL